MPGNYYGCSLPLKIRDGDFDGSRENDLGILISQSYSGSFLVVTRVDEEFEVRTW